jgi:fructokinase
MRIGIDLGGTKIEAVALGDTGEELLRRRVAAPRGDYEATLATLGGLVATVERELGAQGTIGVGVPGTISPATGRMKNANSTWLIGRALDRDLAAALGRPVRLANDADCFTLSEASDGAAAGASPVFGVILGTGVGGGLAVGGQLLSGPNAIAGEWGHNPLPWPNADERPGPLCYCGLTGCIETFLSGPGLAADHLATTGDQLGAPKIVAEAAKGEPAAKATLARYEDRLARALASVINIVDPAVIVLGGGLSNIDSLYSAVPRLLPRYVFSDMVNTQLARAAHGDSSGVRGAAWLWPA